MTNPAKQNTNRVYQLLAIQRRISGQVAFFVTGLVREDREFIEPPVSIDIGARVSERMRPVNTY